MKIKKGDTVTVISGKDKGKKAKVISVPSDTGRVLLEGLNMYKKHERPRQQGKKGQVVERATPIHASNLMLYCAKCKKGARIGAEISKSGKKIRICTRCKTKLD